MDNMNNITSFDGEFRFLSNFWPCRIHAFGHIYTSVEHAYVASKSSDPMIQYEVSRIVTPGQAKRFGRIVSIRDDFDSVKLGFMRSFLEQKFAFGSALWRELAKTKGRQLIEGNAWGDRYWGESPVGTGKNNLGLLLMAIRDDISKIST